MLAVTTSAAATVAAAPRLLGMDAAFVAQRTSDGMIVRNATESAASFGVAEGVWTRRAEDDPHLGAQTARLVRDTRTSADPPPAAIRAAGGVGAYVWAPLQFSDGFQYGMLCVVSHEPRPEMGPRELALLELLARMVCDVLEREELRRTLLSAEQSDAALKLLLTTLDDRDDYERTRSGAVVMDAVAMAERLGLSSNEIADVRHVAMLHDVGKLLIPDAILHKPDTLTPGEWSVMRTHSSTAEELLSHVPSLRHLCAAVRAVHENWDGSGYPDGLSGSEIPQSSRIVHVSAAFQGMVRDRPYRQALTMEDALLEIASRAGAQFCPEAVRSFLSIRQPSLVEERRQQTSGLRARCECLDCGTHTAADVGSHVAGQCPNCRSYNLVAVSSGAPARSRSR